ncbi:hypothetical protein ABT364_22455 [Massilia sp. SR12]
MPSLAQFLMAILLLPCLASAQVPAAYHATVLPFDSGRSILNNAGAVAGEVGGRVALWQRGRGLTYLTASGEEANVWGMNDLGQLVGDDGWQPTLWQLGQPVTRFDAGELGGRALAINNRGSMLIEARGRLGETGFEDEYYLQKKGGQRTPIYGLFPWAINEQDQVAGNLRGSAGGGAVWQDEMLHGLPDNGYSWAGAINEQGWVAGGIGGEDVPPIFAAIWRGDAVETYSPGYARSINDAGMAVGYLYADHAWLWFGGHSYDLNTLWNAADWPGWELVSAEGINNDGLIVAKAQNRGGNWDYMTVLLSPVPEPARAAQLLAGLALLGALRVRRVRK